MNRAAELAEWDSDVLSDLLKDDAETLAGLRKKRGVPIVVEK
jgi:hypothetical protein